MIQANELRIGNYLKELTSDDIFQVKDSYYMALEVNLLCSRPITLTPQWVLELGFKPLIDGFYRIKTKKRGVYLEINLKTKRAILFNKGYVELAFPKYVHRLQNLYFALTNKELTLCQ